MWPVSERHLRRSLRRHDADRQAAHGGARAHHHRRQRGDGASLSATAHGNLPADPVIGDVINVNSPLRFDERMLGGLITYAGGQATFITPFILAGR